MKSNITNAALAILIVAACSTSPAQAQQTGLLPQTIGLHATTKHFQPRYAGDWNELNRGLYLRWANGLTAGYIGKNSNSEPIAYLGYTAQTKPWATPAGGISLGITAGAITGYDKFIQAVPTSSITIPLPTPPLPAGITLPQLSYTTKVAIPPALQPGQRITQRCGQAGCTLYVVQPRLQPLLVPSLAWHAPQALHPFGTAWATRISLLPKANKHSSHAAHLSVEFELP
ncbi:MAG: hypothetical protein ACRCV9_16270 [Burkholderiaceae bacterium]